MTKVRRWDLVTTDIGTISREMEGFLNGEQEVKSVETFTFGRWVVVIALFEKEETL